MGRTSTTLVTIVVALLSLGIVMLASTSSVKGEASFGDPQFFLKRQLAWLVVGIVIAPMIARFDYHWWQKLFIPMTLLSIALLALVFVPPIGVKLSGSSRWLRLFPSNLQFQPSEFAKFSVVIALSSWMARIGSRCQNFKEGLVFPVTGLAIVLGLLIMEPDFGTTLLVGVVGIMIMFAGGTRIGYLFIAGMLGVCGFVLAVMQDSLRMTRVLAFLMPDKYPKTAYHLAQSKIAFIEGGWMGAGLGNSLQKQRYLPEAHTDFILAIIGEELGLLATCGVVVLFIAFLMCGMIIALKAPDRFGKLLAFGLTVTIGLQAAINIGVVTGCLPTKGLPLPFISYGGSSLVMTVVAVSVLLNIAEHWGHGRVDNHTRPIKDSGHWF